MNQDRAASLAATLRGVADELDGTLRTPSTPLPEASGGYSPLITRVLDAAMNMPDAEFLALCNKVLNRYQSAVAALAPPGMAPYKIEELP